jgi:hypothetical protein
MKPGMTLCLLIIGFIVLLLVARFWHIAYRRGILRETFKYFYFEALIDLILVALYCHQAYMYLNFYYGSKEPNDWVYAFVGSIAFFCLAIKKIQNICITGISHSKTTASEFDSVMDGIEIKKTFHQYIRKGQ